MATVFITLQGKGGVGKSFLTSTFAQWGEARGKAVAALDTDTVNPTLASYKALHATHLPLSRDHVLDPRALDTLVASVNDAPADSWIVIDVGSNGFETLMAYAAENEVFALFADLGHELYINTVIAGGADAEETAKGAAALLEVTDAPLVLWLNEHLGPLVLNGTPVQDLAPLKAAGARILGPVVLKERTQATFGRDIEEMLSRRLTFDEAISDFDLMPGTRIKRVRDDIYAQLDSLGLLDV
jgi:hypothetical protein